MEDEPAWIQIKPEPSDARDNIGPDFAEASSEVSASKGVDSMSVESNVASTSSLLAVGISLD